MTNGFEREGAQTPSSARSRRGVYRPESSLGAESALTPHMEKVPSKERPEIEGVKATESYPAREVEREPVTGEELRETLDSKVEKIEALKKEASELISQLTDEERADQANEEHKRLEALSEDFDNNFTSEQADFVGQKRLDETKADMGLYNWTEFVGKLKGATQEELDKDPELERLGSQFDKAFGRIGSDIDWHARRSAEAATDKVARRERLRNTIVKTI